MKVFYKIRMMALMVTLVGGTLTSLELSADEFTEKELQGWTSEYLSVVKEGRQLFTSPTLGTNGVACAQCHPNAANTHPETYPKFQKQLGKVITIADMINWCIANPLEGKRLIVDGQKMTALITYITDERRGVELDPGKH